MRWIEKIRQVFHLETSSADGTSVTSNAANLSAPDSRQDSAAVPVAPAAATPVSEIMKPSAAGWKVPLQSRSAQTARPLHTVPSVETAAQSRYGDFSISFRNDRADGKYSHSINGTYNELMYCALVLVEYMGRQDERAVMDACGRLTEAAQLYHQKRHDRMNRNAAALFAGSDISGILDQDFLGNMQA